MYAMMIPICNEGLASQHRRPRQRLCLSAGGRSQPRIGDGAVKAQKRQTPPGCSEDTRLLPSSRALLWFEMKVEEKGDVGTICGGGGARPASVTNQVVVWSAHCLSVWHFVTPMPCPLRRWKYYIHGLASGLNITLWKPPRKGLSLLPAT